MFWFGLAPWFFGIELVLFIAITTLIEFERYGWSTTLIVLGLLICHLLHVFSITDIIRYHFGTVMLYFLYYIAAGTVWAIIKWWLFLLKFKEERASRLEDFHEGQREAKERFSHGESYHSDCELITKTDYQFLSKEYYKNTQLSRAPKIRAYKNKFVSWLTFWPFSVVGTILHDLIKRISTWIYERFTKMMQWMSDRMVGDIPEPPKSDD